MLQGTQTEIEGSIADHKGSGRNHTLPGLMVGSGALMMFGGLFARRPDGDIE
jgi:hypothetical protein